MRGTTSFKVSHMSAAKSAGARLAVDIGGTFTDIVLEARGQRWTGKVLTTPRAPEEAVVTAVTEILAQAGLKAGALDIFILGTTLATNALIERKGAKTALVTTEGFRDLVEIGWEHRFAQYDIFLDKPAPLVPRHLRLPVPERIDAKGRVLLPLDEAAVEALVPTLKKHGIESVAIAFLQSFTNTAHEQRVKEILKRALPDLWITLSSDVCPEIREYERISTTCANAYVQPVMAGYLNRLQARLKSMGIVCPVYLMTSGGALCTLAMGAAEPVRLVESGPAGGAILARTVAESCGADRALSFDMGGTTAKICFIDDFEPEISRSFEFGRMYRFMKGSGLVEGTGRTNGDAPAETAFYKPVLDAIGDQAKYIGPIGAGSVAKLVHNCYGYIATAAAAEVFSMGVKAGIEPLAIWEAVRQGAIGRRGAFDSLTDQFLSNKYEPPAFALRLAHKDVSLATALGRELNVPMRLANLALADLSEGLNRGWGNRDSRSIMVLQTERAGIEIKVDPHRLTEALENKAKNG